VDEVVASTKPIVDDDPMTMMISPETYKQMLIAYDKFGIYKQRKMLGVQVWRGREWWHG
jgi:hypothetical protein